MKKRNMEKQISLYVEHIGTEHNVFKEDKKYIFIAYIAYGNGYALIDKKF